MKKGLLTLAFCTLVLVLIVACRAPVMENLDGTTSISLTIPNTLFTNSEASSNRAILASTGGIISLKVTATDMTTVTSDFTLSNNTYTATVKVYNGDDRTFTVTATDVNGTTYATGSTTVNITDITETIALTLAPVETVDSDISLDYTNNYTSLNFISSASESDIKEGKVYVLPFSINFTDYSDDTTTEFNTKAVNTLGALTLNIEDSENTEDSLLANGTNTWTPSSEDEVYYVLFTKTAASSYSFVVSQEDGTELVQWSETLATEDTNLYSPYLLQITNATGTTIDFEIAEPTINYYILYYISNYPDDSDDTAARDIESYITGDEVTIKDNIDSDFEVPFTYTGTDEIDWYIVSWNTKADGKGTSYKPQDTITIAESNVFLYAVWEKEDTTEGTTISASMPSFDDTSPTISGSGTEDDPYSVTIGNTLTLTSDTEYTSYQWYLGDDTDLGTEQSATVATDDLSSGVYQVTLLTTDATESEHESSVYIQIEEASTISVTIVTPDDTSPTISGSGTEDDPYSVTIGNTLTLTSDTEYTSYQWYLGNDTDLGTKQSATVATDDLSSGVYLVTLLATDTDDTEYEDSVYITVEEEN